MLYVALAVAVVAAVRGMWSPCGLSMLTSLNPVSETARGNRFWVTALWYVAGALVGGAVLGAGCAVAASGYAQLHAPPSLAWAIALTAALVAVASDSAVFGRSLPDHPRQVDERWLVKYRRWIYAGGYGVQIGTGFATYIMTAAVYLTAVLAVLTGSPVQAVSVALTFGLVRGVTILVAAPARTAEQLRAAHRRIARLTAASLWTCIVVCAAAAAVGGFVLAGAALAGGVAVAAAALAITPSLRPRVVSS
jgi:hypothetical protein